MPERAVFDCTLFLQALTSDKGPAFACFKLVEDGRITLYLSPAILEEINDVLRRPVLTKKYPVLTSRRVDAFISKFKSVGVVAPDPERLFRLPRDADDEPYINLAIAVKASFLVTWNERHLTYLMRGDAPEGKDFCARFRGLLILSPSSFLKAISRESKS